MQYINKAVIHLWVSSIASSVKVVAAWSVEQRTNIFKTIGCGGSLALEGVGKH